MTLWFRNRAAFFALGFGLGGCASNKPAPSTHPAPTAKVSDSSATVSEGAVIAHDFFLRARRMELDGNEAVALGYYKIAFGYDSQSRDLCFILLDRLREAGKLDSAIAHGKNCFRIAGTPTAAEHQAMGEVYLRADSLRPALRHYRLSADLNGEDKDVLYTLVNLYERVQDIPQYANALERLVPKLDYPQRLVEKLLQVYRLLGRNNAGEPVLREAWRATGRPSFGENLAAYYESRDMVRPWLEMAEALFSSARENGTYALMYARALNACGQPDSALSVYRERLMVNPKDPDALFPVGVLLHDLGRLAEAHETFSALAADYPDHPMYQYFLGSTGMELRKPDYAGALEKAVALEPTVPEYWARLIYADFATGRDSLAGTRLFRLAEQGKSWQGALFQGLIYSLVARHLDPRTHERVELFHDSTQARRQRRLAVDFFKRSLAGNPDNRRVHFELGTNLERLGERREAMRILRALVRIDTANAVAMNYLGYMLVEDGKDLEFAGQLLDKALALDPENGAYLDSKGWWFYRKGDYAAARGMLEKAAVLLPKDLTVLEHLAMVLDKLGDVPAAQVAWDRLIRLDPKQAETRGKPADQKR